jgi:hypothetical protein
MQPVIGDYHRFTEQDDGSLRQKKIQKSKTPNNSKLIDKESTRVTLLWVLSHVGIPGNGTADNAAQEALNEEIHNTEKYPPQDLIEWIKKKSCKELELKTFVLDLYYKICINQVVESIFQLCIFIGKSLITS